MRWVDDERLLISGADGAEVPPRLLEKTIVQRTGQLMYELLEIYPEISGILPVPVCGAVCVDGRGRAVHRAAS